MSLRYDDGYPAPNARELTKEEQERLDAFITHAAKRMREYVDKILIDTIRGEVP